MASIGRAEFHLRVPRVTYRQVLVPAPLRQLTQAGFKDSAWFADIDGNELLKCDPHGVSERDIPKLSGANLSTAISFLKLSGQIVYITGSMFAHQETRTVIPIKEELRNLGQLHLMRQVALYANRGASCGWYSEGGERDENLYKDYIGMFGIPNEYISVIQTAAEEAKDWFWTEYQKNIDQFHRLHPDYLPEGPPVFQIRDACRVDGELFGAPQLALLPFPGDNVLREVIEFIEKRLARANQTEVLKEIAMTPGGGTTVDINRAGVSKATAFQHFITERLRISLDTIENPLVHPLPYSGDETSRIILPDGQEKRGGDTFPLAVPNCFILGFDPDSQNAIKIPGRAFYIGRGPEANLALRQWIVKNWGKEQPDPQVTVPFMEPVETPVPQKILEAMAADFKNMLLACSGSLITGFQHEKDIKATKVDPTVLQISEHLQKGRPFLIISGGDFTSRLVPILDVIKEILENRGRPADLTNLLAFSNNGAASVQFSDSGSESVVIPPERIIDSGDVEPLEKILQKILEDYRKKFPRALNLPILQRRIFREQVLQLTILPFDLSTRGWIQYHFGQALSGQPNFLKKYSGQFGGYSYDVGKIGNTKQTCLKEALNYFHLPEDALIIYFGGQFFSDVDITGETINGVDMSALKLPGVLPMALNDDQGSVPDNGRIIPAGSGGEALASWLEFMHNPLKKMI